VQPLLAMPVIAKQPAREIVSDLAPGEWAFVTPAALMVAADRTCAIQTDASIRRTPDDTANMHVTRTATGYIADVTYCHFQWTPTDWTDSGPHAPVVHVVFGDAFLQ
jgi:hypothetical protein